MRSVFDKKYGIDSSLYNMLNRQGQKYTLKSLDHNISLNQKLAQSNFRETVDQPQRSILNASFSIDSNEGKSPIIRQSALETNCSTVRLRHSNQFKGSDGFAKLAGSLMQNPFNQTATINNSDQGLYDRRSYQINPILKTSLRLSQVKTLFR